MKSLRTLLVLIVSGYLFLAATGCVEMDLTEAEWEEMEQAAQWSEEDAALLDDDSANYADEDVSYTDGWPDPIPTDPTTEELICECPQGCSCDAGCNADCGAE
ncbi:hypothetical protein [Haliangium sp.]|uniref:hypothetical protein n=1 Tax=Haliangium sp. TaxID=2663208 RepID=UPI003D12285D